MATIYPFTPYESRAASPPAQAETPLTFTKEEHTDRDFVCSF